MEDNTNIINILFKQWIDENPERFDEKEIERVSVEFKHYLDTSETSDVVSDEIYDFFVAIEMCEPRHEVFGNYIINSYPKEKYKNVLDVGAGRLCKLSEFLSMSGYTVTAMDEKIRLTNKEADEKNIEISNCLFECDEYSKTGKGTDITSYDLILGLEPCDATEHIIRQCTSHNTPFAVKLCAAPHNALEDGRSFETYDQWYEYLGTISENVKFEKMDSGNVVVRNEIELDIER